MTRAPQWPVDGGEMGARIRAHDWSRTALGPITDWPQTLRTNIDTLLGNLFPSILLWGPELTVCAYNDAYRPMLGGKPEALGRPFLDVWSEARDIIAPYLEKTLQGQAFFFHEAPFTLSRFDYPEQTYFDYAYSPVRRCDGTVAGVLNTAVEVTARVQAAAERERYEEELKGRKDSLQAEVMEQTAVLRESRSALERQTHFFDAIMSNVHSQIFVWDLDRRFVYANRATEKLWGLDRNDYLGKTMEELGYTPELSALLARQIDQVIKTGEPVTGDTDYASPIGVEGHYTYVLSPLIEGEGKIQRVVGIARDITRRKKLEQALEKANAELEIKIRERTEHLRESEQRYRTLFESIDEGFCIIQLIFDANGKPVDHRYLETNPAFERHTDLRSVQGKTVSELVPKLEPKWHEVYGRVANTGRAERFVNWSEALGRWFEVDAFRVGDPAENKIALLFRDVTERKGAEEELLRVLGLIEGIARGSEDLIAALDGEFRFLYFNEAYRHEFKKLWGYDIQEGANLLEAMGPWPAEQRKAKELWVRALAGESFRVQEAFGPSEQQARVYDLRFNPIRDSQGRAVGAAHIFRDITEQVRMQESLRDSEERLRESDRRKDEYLAMLGHELRNPLAAVRSATELVKRIDTGDPRLQRASGVLERQTAHMATLIDGLLEVSRIARGKIDLDQQTLDLREVFEGVLQDRRSQIASRGLTLDMDFPAEPLWVSGDHVRLAQVFDNLMGNALKFTQSPGNILVTLSCENDWVVARVRDSGVGIRAETLARIFEPFHQETQDIARGAGGLGLGLALAKGLVELHNGFIEAHSAGPGAGAEFRVGLPVTAAPAQTIDARESRRAPSRRILIVEDNPDAGQALCDLLELQGHSPILAENADAGLSALRRHPVDVVLCDLGLPGMSGYELAAIIRDDAELRHIPLVALTGYGQPEDRQRTAAAGFDSHLIKPVDLSSLNQTLSQFTAA